MNKASWKRRAKQAEQYAEMLEKQIKELEFALKHEQGHYQQVVKQLDSLKEDYNLLRQENQTLECANDKPE